MTFAQERWLDDSTDLGPSYPLRINSSLLTVTASWSGTPAANASTVAVEGSLEGDAWFPLGNLTPSAPILWVTGKPVAMVRLNQLELNGTGDPAVTVSVLAQ